MAGRDLSQVFPSAKFRSATSSWKLEPHRPRRRNRRTRRIDRRGPHRACRIDLGLTPGGAQSPREAIAKGIAYVPGDRQRNGVIPDMTVAHNISLADLASVSSNGFLDTARERNIAAELSRSSKSKLRRPTPKSRRSPGGSQQKVAIARWLHTKPRVLILDEPTQGIDVGAKAEVHRQMVELAASGVAILMISSRTPRESRHERRVAVMSKGRIVGILDRSEATQEKILAPRSWRSTGLNQKTPREFPAALALAALLIVVAISAPAFFRGSNLADPRAE
jgi:ABC-type sugar transport system ATPase subunit